MRIKTIGDDLTGYYVAVTRENPRSEEHIPLAVFLQGIKTPPQPDEEAGQPEEDLPAFLRPKDGLEPPPQRRVPITDPVGDAIHAVNEVETRVVGLIDGLRQRIDDLAYRPADSQPPADPGHDEAVSKLSSYLDGLSEQVARATKMASEALAAAKKRPEAPDARTAACLRVRDAAAEVRGRTIGVDADDRDTVRRLVDVAMNARAGNGLAVAHMDEIGAAVGRSWGDVAKEIIATHDRANAITVRTHIIETRALADISSAADEHVDEIAAKAVEDLKKVGE